MFCYQTDAHGRATAFFLLLQHYQYRPFQMYELLELFYTLNIKIL